MPACVRHPDVETELRCSSCETLICPRCLIYTPAGARCSDCAGMRRLPMYELDARHYLRGIGIALLLAAALGLAGAFLMPPSTVAHTFRLIAGLIAGVGAGSLMAGGIDLATGGKRGVQMQVLAVVALTLAALLRLVFAGELDYEVASRDTTGILAAVIGSVTAWGRLR